MGEKVSIQDVVDLLANEKNLNKQETEAFIRTMFNLIEEALENDQYVKIKGWGTFRLVKINSRESVDVNSGERIIIEGHSRISFTPDTAMRDLINKPFAHFETVILNDSTVFDDLPAELEEDSEENSEPEEIILSENEEKDNPEEIITSDSVPIEETISEVSMTEGEKETSTIAEEKRADQHTESIKVTDMKPEDKQGLPYFIAIVTIIILIISGTIIYIYNPRMLLNLLPETKKTEEVIDSVGSFKQKPTDKQEVGKPDMTKLDTIKKEDLPFEKVIQEIKEEREARKAALARIEAGTTTPVKYQITGTKATYTLQPGESLTKVSLHFYGTKELWPYIVKHNQDIIKNPDNVPYGTIIKIPELKANMAK